jgi:hypothetical protein
MCVYIVYTHTYFRIVSVTYAPSRTSRAVIPHVVCLSRSRHSLAHCATEGLLSRSLPVRRQDRIDDRHKGIKLGTRRRSRPTISRWRRGAHLRNGVPAHAKHPSGFAPTVTLDQNKLANRRVNLHGKHPSLEPSRIGKAQAYPVAGFYSRAAAPSRRFTGRVLQRCLQWQLALRRRAWIGRCLKTPHCSYDR